MKLFFNSVKVFCTVFLVSITLKASAEKLNSSAGFIQNKGQILDQFCSSNSNVLFLYNGKGIKVQLRRSGYSYELFSASNLPKNIPGQKFHDVSDLEKVKVNSYRVDIDFYGTTSTPEIITSQANESYLNYFMNGTQISNVRSFNKVTYKNVFPATDIEFTINSKDETEFKYNIILHPGADINNVKLLCKGASSIIRTDYNALNIATPLGIISENIPFSYYSDTPAENKNVNFNVEKNIISFSANYDKTKTFVIDPSSKRIWGTYYGGNQVEYCTGNAIDNQNNLFVGGYTASSSNIATAGTYQNIYNAGIDAYLAKFNSNGAMLWGTYWGGNSVDVIYNLCVVGAGTVYVCGASASTASVATAGAHQTVYGGGINDGTLARFDTNGQMVWATYYGGTMHDIGAAVTVDNSGNVIMTGHSESTTNIATNGSYNNVYGLNYDAFVAKFNNLGVRQWGTYYGDTNVDEGWGVSCDASNNIYVTGFTASLFGISTGTAHQTIKGGNQDAFVAKFDAAGVNLLWGTYYGGTGNDQGYSIQVATNGSVYVSGNTTSTNNIASSNGYQQATGSSDDAFLACFNLSGVRQWGTYFGGNDVDYIWDLTVDVKNNVLFCGQTLSTNSISTTGAYQPAIGAANFYDAYFAKFSAAGALKLATYYGGTDSELGSGISLDAGGQVYISGETSSTVTMASSGSYQQTYAGAQDAFVAKFCITPDPSLSPASQTICTNKNYTLTAPSGYTTYAWSNGYTVNPIVVPGTTFTATYFYTVAVTDAFGCDGYSDTAKVLVITCVGVPELTGDNQLINLFPVPSNDIIYVDLKNIPANGNIKLKIYNCLGELISEKETTEEIYSYDIKQLPSGMYFLRATQKEKVFERKFIKN